MYGFLNYFFLHLAEMETDYPIPLDENGGRRSARGLHSNTFSAEIIQRRRSTSLSDDYSVQKTNDDAAESKYVAVKVCFFEVFQIVIVSPVF